MFSSAFTRDAKMQQYLNRHMVTITPGDYRRLESM